MPGNNTPAVTPAEQNDDTVDSTSAATPESAVPTADGKTGDQGTPGDHSKAGEGDQTTPGAYADFTVPEGMDIDAELLGKATPLFEKYNISKEDAQSFVNLYAGQIQAGSQRQVDAFNQLMTDWQNQSTNDKEFGGDKFEESVKTARAAVEKFGTPELKQLLEEQGVGNHPEVIRFMYRVGKLTAEDNPAATKGTAPRGEKDRISILYPSESA